ncbi:MAG: anaerobic sulfatase maturase [Bacteroidales bacterium]|nr:anaerobic sulfatase maturase [Bacteroidales bacterium]
MAFQIFVKPVGGVCNLRCDYCYYRDDTSSLPVTGGNVMADNLLETYIAAHLAEEEDDTVLFSWHGGEPLLAGIEFYKRVVEIQNRVNRDHKRIINGIQTNGTLLTDLWGRFLKENSFIAGLSVDGPLQLHNLFRKSASGTGSFNRVMKGWDVLKRWDIPYEILCVVNSANVKYPAEIYRFFTGEGARHITFLPLVERIQGSVVSERSVDPVLLGRFLSEIFDIWKREHSDRVRIQIFDEAIGAFLGQEHSLCIFRPVCGGVPVIEFDGNYYPCDHYALPDFLYGNILTDSLHSLLSGERQLKFGAAKAELPHYCRECNVLEMCNGGCPRNRFIRTPAGEEGLNYLCEGYKIIFNHILPFARSVAAISRSRGGRQMV